MMSQLTESEPRAEDIEAASPIYKALTEPDYASLAAEQELRLTEPGQQPDNASGPTVYLGLDSEYTTIVDDAGQAVNRTISLQTVLDHEERRSEVLHMMPDGERSSRPSLRQLMGSIITTALSDGTLFEVPSQAVVFAHFLRADAPAVRDFFERRSEFTSLGRTIASDRKGHTVYYKPPDGGRSVPVKVIFIDTMRLTPGQGALAVLGELIGVPKLDLHRDLGVPDRRTDTVSRFCPSLPSGTYGIGRMDLVATDLPEAFSTYAMQDARIALEGGLAVMKFAREQLGLKSLPRTLSGMARRYQVKEAGGSAKMGHLLGRSVKRSTKFDERTRRFVTSDREYLDPGLTLTKEFGRAAYHGGRNEAITYGPSEDGPFYDFDIQGAYTTILGELRPLNYAGARQVTDAAEFKTTDAGFAWITFKFPAETRYPCLPVRGEGGSGLFFPLEGRREDHVFVTASEIVLARSMGAQVTVIQGVIVPWTDDKPIYKRVIRTVAEKRRAFPKRTHPAWNALWKEMGNSLYGMTAQGLRDKAVFDVTTLSSEKLEHSSLTEPIHAALVTGRVRAVLGEIAARLSLDRTIVSLTTDGLLTNARFDELDLSGPQCNAFADANERLTGQRIIIDPTPKHAAAQVVSIRTRWTFTARRLRDAEPVCAKGGVKFAAAPRHHNKRMLDLYVRHRYGEQIEHEQLISAREQMISERDLVGITARRQLNMRPDLKRRPVNAREVALSSRLTRLAFDTVPWRTVSEAEFARERLRSWSHSRKAVLMTLPWYQDWAAFYEFSVSLSEAALAAGVRMPPIREDGAVGFLRRQFLQAGRTGVWGVRFPDRKSMVIARALTDAGFPTSKEDVTYAGRRRPPLLAHAVFAMPETLRLLDALLAQSPTFEWWHAFRWDDHAAVEAHLGRRGTASV